MILKINNLSKYYTSEGKQINIFKNISFGIKQGQIAIIQGPSGIGKSTLLRCINRLDNFSGGEILFLEKTIYDYCPEYIRRNIGIVFQNYNLFPHLNVINNITLAPIALKLSNKTLAEKQAQNLLERLGISEKAKAYPCELSGGQKQRVAIARALIMKPKVMLFDEPTAALDQKTSNELADIIKDIASDGMGVLIVTHELAFFKNFADVIIDLF